MSDVIHLSKGISVKKHQLPGLVFGYALSSRLIIPDDVTQVITDYIPKETWFKTGDYCTISGSILSYKRDKGYAKHSTGYSSQIVTMDSKSSSESTQYKHVWEIKIVEKKAAGQSDGGYSSDTRLGISSTLDHLNGDFSNSQKGHNYSYISLIGTSYVGYNGKWTEIDKSAEFFENDIVKIELNAKDREISYFKNNEFIHKQSDIQDGEYRLAALILGCSGKVEIVSFTSQKIE